MPPPGNRPRNDTLPANQDFKHAGRFTRQTRRRDQDGAIVLDIVVDLNPRLNIGDGPLGRRILFGAAGGRFEGPRLRGEVVPGGGDWALFRADGAMSLDVRLTLRTHDDALVHMTYAAAGSRRPNCGPKWPIPRNDIRSIPRAITSAPIRCSKPGRSSTPG